MLVKRILMVTPFLVLGVLVQSLMWVPTYQEQTKGNPRRLTQYITGSIGDASLLNPILAADSSSVELAGLIFEGLLDRDEELRFRGRLATHWEITEEAYFRVHRPPQTMVGAAGEELLEWLREKLEGWPQVLKVELVAREPHSVKVNLPEQPRGPAVDVRVSPPPDVRITLKEVDQDFFQKLEPILGEGYFESFRPEQYCDFPDGVDPRIRVQVAREILPAVEHNPVILFHLREGVLFHDGVPVTSRDVLFTYEAIMDPSNLSPRVSDFEPVLKVETPDDTTVRVVYKRLYSPALGTWSMGILPEHMLNREALAAEARSRGMDPAGFGMRQSNFNRNPVGCGPFRFNQWKTDQFVSLTRFEEYWEGAPNYEEYIFRVVPDLVTQEMEFYAGTLDSYAVQPHQVERLQHDPRFQAFSGISFGYTYIGYNLRREPFNDVRVRKALGMAIDVEKILDYVLHGQAERITGPFPKQTDYYDPGIQPLPYDPEGALRILEEAGWRKDASGRLSKDGRPMRFTLITNSGNELRKAILAVAQDAWRQMGIEVRTDMVEWAVFINERINKRDFDAVVLGWSMGIDPDLYQIWHSSQTGPHQLNFVGFQDPEADELIVRIRQEYDHHKQVELCRRLHGIIAREQPYTFLYVTRWTAVLDKRIVIMEKDQQGKPLYRRITPTRTGNYAFHFNKWVKLPQAPVFDKE
jgi:ABC-type transport system substrate-binding protein